MALEKRRLRISKHHISKQYISKQYISKQYISKQPKLFYMEKYI